MSDPSQSWRRPAHAPAVSGTAAIAVRIEADDARFADAMAIVDSFVFGP